MTLLSVLSFNAASAMPNNRRPLAMRILEAASTHASVLAGCECDDLDDDSIAKVLDPHVWWWVHSDQPARDGLLVAGRHDRTTHGPPRYHDGAPASPVNAAREILRVRLEVDQRWSFTLAQFHAPKDPNGEGWFAHGEMMRNSREVGADLLSADVNVRAPAMRKAYPKRTIRSSGVLMLAGAERLVLSGAREIDLLPGETGDDHKAVKSVIHPRTRSRR